MNTIETIDNSPFRHLISTIGELPTSFTESMSYYEMLAWLCDFIDKKVVPAINVNAEALKELRDYVEHYFDNLDVQEEINNKLDAMAESGELEEIIAQYIQLSSVLAYDTVADMKSATNLVDGSFVETYGFNTKGDNGGAKYKVRELTNVDTIDEITIIALADETLIAEFIPENETIYTAQFGIVGDGTTDETTKAQTFFGYSAKKYVINSANILVDENLEIQSNSTVEFLEGCKITRKPTDDSIYFILDIVNKENIVIENAYLVGDRDSHLDDSGEWGYGINCVASTNVKITNATIESTWGDGIYVGYSYEVENIGAPKNILIDGCYIKDCSRNGISICSGEDIIVSNCIIYGTNRTEPKAGIDIEPEGPAGVTPALKNVQVINVNTQKNDKGIALDAGTSACENVIIKGHNAYEDNYGFVVFSFNGTSTIVYEDALITKAADSAIQITKKKTSTLVIRNVVVDTSRKNNVTHAYDGAVVIATSSADDGGIILDNIVSRKSYTALYDWQDLICVRGTGTLGDLTMRNINTTKNIYLTGMNMATTKYENCNIVFDSNYYLSSIGAGQETCANRIYSTDEIVANTSRTIYGLPDGDYYIDSGKNTGYNFVITFDNSFLIVYNGSALDTRHTMTATTSGASMHFRKKGSTIIVESAIGFTLS